MEKTAQRESQTIVSEYMPSPVLVEDDDIDNGDGRVTGRSRHWDVLQSAGLQDGTLDLEQHDYTQCHAGDRECLTLSENVPLVR